ncbi:MAG TPA: hypothetical protein VNN21_09980 [Dehalococcoidia bacterium]|nr:hypothetical protein [Dehalococcoidia bacterium]
MKLAAIGFLAALAAVVLLACGGDGTRTTDDGGAMVSGAGSVAPNVFLRFEGRTYRLRDLLQANLPEAAGDYREVGSTTDADIDFDGRLRLYKRAGDPDALYSYSPGVPGTSGQAFWLRWLPEASGAAAH